MPAPVWLLAVEVLSAAWWTGAALEFAAGGSRSPGLGDVAPLPDDRLPSLTIIATAKDEAARVETAARSLLAQDHPGARVVVVDDRSTDGTGAILDRLAAQRPELRVIHVASLPEGWIGKCHALAQGAASADTEWLLFTDGDVSLASDAVRRALSLALRENADHVAVGPDLVLDSLGEAIFVGYFFVMFSVSQRPWRARDPRSKAHIGIGAFNLVRRAAYERAGGHAAIRFDLIDDMALAKRLKDSGARALYARHGGRVTARWHAGVSGLIRGVEKNAFPAMGYRTGFTLAAVAALLAVSMMPVVGLALADPVSKILAAVAWLAVAALYASASREARIRPWQAVLMPVGALLFCGAILRSAALALVRGAVSWRGTAYPLGELRRRRTWG
jgi:hypothetical protein